MVVEKRKAGGIRRRTAEISNRVAAAEASNRETVEVNNQAAVVVIDGGVEEVNSRVEGVSNPAVEASSRAAESLVLVMADWRLAATTDSSSKPNRFHSATPRKRCSS